MTYIVGLTLFRLTGTEQQSDQTKQPSATMLQFVENNHDSQYSRHKSGTADSLAASQNDGKIHLLLAASVSTPLIYPRLGSLGSQTPPREILYAPFSLVFFSLSIFWDLDKE